MIMILRNIKIIALLTVIFSFCMCSKNNPDPDLKPESVTDIDGNIYKVVKIGKQTWMAENLKVTHYLNGDAIENIKGDLWDNQTVGAFCIYNNDETVRSTYGLIYNWYAVIDTRKLCPVGWHIASYDDWETLSASGMELKEQGTNHWISTNNCLAQFSGFNGLPGGSVGYDGSSNSLGEYGYWWTSSEDDADNAWIILMTNINTGLTGGLICINGWEQVLGA
jgi:uncharacterized protein (TIGR02145 family)